LIAGWWQLAATEILACLCKKLEVVASMAAFFKTFPKREAKSGGKRAKVRIGITIGTTCHTCHRCHQETA
jgi:hypothetical protein